VINKFYKDADSFMTHADVSEFREWDCVPEQFNHMIKSKPKAKPKAKVAKKVAVKATAKPKAAKKATAKPKAATKKPTLTNRVDAMEAKLDKIFEILSAK